MNEALVFTDALRAAVPAEPDPGLREALVPRLASIARASALEAETLTARRGAAPVRWRPRSRLALLARAGIAVVLVPVLLAGLAVAGVTVPSPARSAFDAVGINLPNQPAEKSERSGTGQGSQAPAAKGTGQTGSSNATSRGNSHSAHQHALSQRAKAKGKAVGHSRGKAIGLNEATPPGQSGQTGPPTHSNAGGNGGGSASANASVPKSTHAPKGVAKGHMKVAPG